MSHAVCCKSTTYSHTGPVVNIGGQHQADQMCEASAASVLGVAQMPSPYGWGLCAWYNDWQKASQWQPRILEG